MSVLKKAFEKEVLPALKFYNQFVGMNPSGGYIIDTWQYGRLTFFPKADKIQVHDKGKWLTNGVRILLDIIAQH